MYRGKIFDFKQKPTKLLYVCFQVCGNYYDIYHLRSSGFADLTGCVSEGREINVRSNLRERKLCITGSLFHQHCHHCTQHLQIKNSELTMHHLHYITYNTLFYFSTYLKDLAERALSKALLMPAGVLFMQFWMYNTYLCFAVSVMKPTL